MIRWLALAVLLGAVGTSAYYRRRARLASEVIPRRREGVLTAAARAGAGLSVVAVIVAHVLEAPTMAWASFQAPPWVGWTGAVMGVCTIPAVRWILATLGANVSETVLTKRDHRLVTTGPYRWVRHPLYTTGIVLIVAMALMLRSWLLLVAAAMSLVAVRTLVIPAEEQQLQSKFGDEYAAYRRRTGQFLPRLTVIRR
jgi:protein-S-isoprenylcysteine O-methyltransferase Ste14